VVRQNIMAGDLMMEQNCSFHGGQKGGEGGEKGRVGKKTVYGSIRFNH
jgi:hypothetical protein